MTNEIFCVILGWLISQCSDLLIYKINERKQNKAMLEILLREFDLQKSLTIDAMESPIFLSKYNEWWRNNKLLYFTNLPKEAKYFDIWNTISEDGPASLNGYLKTCDALKSHLTKSMQFWSRPLYQILILQIIPRWLRPEQFLLSRK